jgi:hypothetical protein
MLIAENDLPHFCMPTIMPWSSGASCLRYGGGGIGAGANQRRELTRVVNCENLKNWTDFFPATDRT